MAWGRSLRQNPATTLANPIYHAVIRKAVNIPGPNLITSHDMKVVTRDADEPSKNGGAAPMNHGIKIVLRIKNPAVMKGAFFSRLVLGRCKPWWIGQAGCVGNRGGWLAACIASRPNGSSDGAVPLCNCRMG
jgi:hypothetical protein